MTVSGAKAGETPLHKKTFFKTKSITRTSFIIAVFISVLFPFAGSAQSAYNLNPLTSNKQKKAASIISKVNKALTKYSVRGDKIDYDFTNGLLLFSNTEDDTLVQVPINYFYNFRLIPEPYDIFIDQETDQDFLPYTKIIGSESIIVGSARLLKMTEEQEEEVIYKTVVRRLRAFRELYQEAGFMGHPITQYAFLKNDWLPEELLNTHQMPWELLLDGMTKDYSNLDPGTSKPLGEDFIYYEDIIPGLPQPLRSYLVQRKSTGLIELIVDGIHANREDARGIIKAQKKYKVDKPYSLHSDSPFDLTVYNSEQKGFLYTYPEYCVLSLYNKTEMTKETTDIVNALFSNQLDNTLALFRSCETRISSTDSYDEISFLIPGQEAKFTFEFSYDFVSEYSKSPIKNITDSLMGSTLLDSRDGEGIKYTVLNYQNQNFLMLDIFDRKHYKKGHVYTFRKYHNQDWYMGAELNNCVNKVVAQNAELAEAQRKWDERTMRLRNAGISTLYAGEIQQSARNDFGADIHKFAQYMDAKAEFELVQYRLNSKTVGPRTPIKMAYSGFSCLTCSSVTIVIITRKENCTPQIKFECDERGNGMSEETYNISNSALPMYMQNYNVSSGSYRTSDCPNFGDTGGHFISYGSSNCTSEAGDVAYILLYDK